MIFYQFEIPSLPSLPSSFYNSNTIYSKLIVCIYYMPQIKDNGKLVKTTLLENRSFYFIVSVCLVYFIFISFLFYLIFLIIHKQKVSKISS